jgi:hypothetical protein
MAGGSQCACRLVGWWWCGRVAGSQQACRAVASVPASWYVGRGPEGPQGGSLVGRWVGGGGGVVLFHLFYKCIVRCRSLPWVGVQGAKVSALPGASPQPIESPMSWQGP